MFKGDAAGGELNGFLDAGSHIDGTLRFEQTFRVDGKVTGQVRSEGDLVIGESGVVDADVLVGRLFVSGELKGEARATRKIELAPSARVEGSLSSPALVIEEGAQVEGRCVSGPVAETGGASEPAASTADGKSPKLAPSAS